MRNQLPMVKIIKASDVFSKIPHQHGKEVTIYAGNRSPDSWMPVLARTALAFAILKIGASPKLKSKVVSDRLFSAGNSPIKQFSTRNDRLDLAHNGKIYPTYWLKNAGGYETTSGQRVDISHPHIKVNANTHNLGAVGPFTLDGTTLKCMPKHQYTTNSMPSYFKDDYTSQSLINAIEYLLVSLEIIPSISTSIEKTPGNTGK